ncbi:integrase, putative [Pseudomonas sessilinigenes]|nr:integrase, putative [Pseudomonas sessilinigenes]
MAYLARVNPKYFTAIQQCAAKDIRYDLKQTPGLHKHWVPVLNEPWIRRRPPYNCRHTYATICSMSGLNPAFIAQQLGHSMQMLLSTYARWLNSSSDWSELEKLKIGIKSVSAENPAS